MPPKTKTDKYNLRDDLIVEWLNAVARLLNYSERPGSRNGFKSPKSATNLNEVLAPLWEKTRVNDIGNCRTGLQFLVCIYDLDIEETVAIVALLFEYLAIAASVRTDISIAGLFHTDDVAASLVNAYEITGPRSKLVTKGIIGRRGLFGSDVFLTPRVLRYFGIADERRRIVNELTKNRRNTNDDLVEVNEPRVRLSDVVLPAATRETLKDALYFIRNRDTILSHAGLDDRIEKGKGVALLFYGPPGTGKSMAAEAFAGELKIRFTVVRPERLESSYFAETEKRVVRLFEEAEKYKRLLIFDECDSLFATRPHGNAYQNMIVSRCINLLLRGIEEGTQVYILTTNRPDYLDPALERRLAAKVEFGLPDEPARRELWLRFLPANHVLTRDDINALAARYPLTGGYIKQAALAALRRAAREGRPINKEDIAEALSVYQEKERKMGF